MLERFVFRWAKALPSSNVVSLLLSGSFSTPHDTKRSAFCTEKSRHHQHALHVCIARSLQYCVRVDTVGPLAFASENTPRLVHSQAVHRSLYQRPLDADLAATTLSPRVARVHPRIVYAC